MEWLPDDDALLDRTLGLASPNDIMNLDALDVAAAERVGVQEFATPERPVFLGDL